MCLTRSVWTDLYSDTGFGRHLFVRQPAGLVNKKNQGV